MTEPTYRPKQDQMTIAFTGRIGPRRDNDYSDSGKTPRLRLSVANSRVAGKGDDLREETTWINVVIFGAQATGLAKLDLKGSQCAVKGSLQDGQTQRVKTVGNGEREFNMTDKEVVTDMRGGFVLLGRPGNGSSSNGADPAATEAEPAAVAADGDDIPF